MLLVDIFRHRALARDLPYFVVGNSESGGYGGPMGLVGGHTRCPRCGPQIPYGFQYKYLRRSSRLTIILYIHTLFTYVALAPHGIRTSAHWKANPTAYRVATRGGGTIFF